jgi:hypothetical protein
LPALRGWHRAKLFSADRDESEIRDHRFDSEPKNIDTKKTSKREATEDILVRRRAGRIEIQA